MSKLQRRWNAHEDSTLQREVELQCAANNGVVRDWNSIAKRIKGRSNKDCRKRFYNGITKGLRKGPWTNDEDKQLEKLVRRHGPSWAVIAQDIRTRSADQCSKRWQHCLDPELDRSSWSQTENFALLNAVRTHESAWKDIQVLHFPRRSANNVKNQYSALKRKGMRLMEDTLSCCPDGTHDQGLAVHDRWTSKQLNPSDPLEPDVGKPSSSVLDMDCMSSESENSFRLAVSENEDPFQWLTSETESSIMTPDSVDDFGTFNPQPDLPIDSLDMEPPSNLGFDLESVGDFDSAGLGSGLVALEQKQANSVNQACTGPSQANDKVDPRKTPQLDAFSVSDDFMLDYEPRLSQSPSSANTSIPLPTRNCTQLTIQIDGADPSTLSAVMGTLIQSRARFKFDNY